MTNKYPHEPGFYAHAPETSREAADAIAPIASSIRTRVRAVIYETESRGIIADEVADRLGLNVYQVRARISELHAAKEIADSGRRATGASGKRTAVWVARQFGPPDPHSDDRQGSFLDLPEAA